MTPLAEIKIQGFRSLKQVSWAPDRLNVIIGQNGSGKSNLLWALKLLQDSARRRLRDSALGEGGLRQLLWNHQAADLAWALTLNVRWPQRSHNRLLTYELALRPQGFEGGFRVERELLADYAPEKSREMIGPFKLLERDAQNMALWDGKKLIPLTDETAESANTTAPDAITAEETLLSLAYPAAPAVDPWMLLYFRDLNRIGIYHDMVTHRRALVREAAVARVERHLESDGQNLVPLLHTLYSSSRDFKRTLDDAMQAAFGKDFEALSFPPAADQKIQLGVQWKSLKVPVSAASLSDGTLRFMMLVAILANADQVPLIAIDEPETGLHPRMLRIVAELAAAAAERSTILLTTHSPEFLNAFPQGDIPTTTVAELVDGQTEFSPKHGEELKRWLKEYSLGELLASGDLEALH